MKKVVSFFLFCVVLLDIGVFFKGASYAQSQCDDELMRIQGIASLLEKKRALQGLVSRCGSHAETNYQYAYCLERLRKYSEAVPYYEKATKLDPRNPKYLFGLGDVYRILGRVREAREAYRAGLSIAPGNRRVERCLHELEKMASSKEDNAEHGGGAPKGPQKEVITPTPHVARTKVVLKISRPYMQDMDPSSRMRQLVRAASTDKRITDISIREFSRSKALDEQYFVNGEGSIDGQH